MHHHNIDKINYRELLDSALDPSQERRMDQAFRAFHRYSTLNQVLAMRQLDEVAPIASKASWLKKGRTIKPGAKPISLIVPVMAAVLDSFERQVFLSSGYLHEVLVGFRYEAKWYSLKQTEGEPLDWRCDQVDIGQWDVQLAQKSLGIRVADFDMLDGNTQGFAKRSGIGPSLRREVAINPLAIYPQAAMFHEFAHHVLGHLDGYYGDVKHMSNLEKYSIKEVEAESVAFICCASLGLKGLAESRDYIQIFLMHTKLNDKQAQRIFSAANKILKAGFLL